MADLGLNLDLDLDINTDFIDGYESNEHQESSQNNLEFHLEENTQDVLTIFKTIKDFYFKLQNGTIPDNNNNYESYFQIEEVLKWFQRVKDNLKDQSKPLSFEDLIEFSHMTRLLVKFLNNIAISNIKKNLTNGTSIDLNKIFNIIDDKSLSYTTISHFGIFLVESSTFENTDEFIKTLGSYVDISDEKKNLITLQIIDAIYPLSLTVDFKTILIKLYANVNEINDMIKTKLLSELNKTVPNIKELLNNNTDVLLYIFSITKSIINLTKMNHKTLANLGKSNNSNESTYLYRHIENIFPFILEKRSSLNDILYNQIKVKAAQRLANKIILLSKVDFYKGSSNGTTGKHYYAEMIETIDKWIENDRPKVNSLADNDIKPLPIPKDNNYVDKKNKKTKKRAGKKLTKFRQRFQHTGDLDKLKNQLEFGKKETFEDGKDQYLDDMEDSGLGMAAEKYKKLTSKGKQTKRVNKPKP